MRLGGRRLPWFVRPHMDRAEWGKTLFYGFGLVEGGGVVNGATYSTVTNVAIVGCLMVILPFLIGYLIARFGLIYGLVLGIAPAIFALSELPTEILGLPRIDGAVLLFFVYVMLAGVCGFAGQRLALWRNAA